MIKVCTSAFAAAFLALATPAEPIAARVFDVYDGDTLTVELANGERVRFIGIDTPELRNNRHGPAHELGSAAALYLAQLLNGATVRLETGVRERDHYGRVLAYVYRADTFINLEMVRAGYAVTYTVPPDVAHTDDFLAAERDARTEGRGLWSP